MPHDVCQFQKCVAQNHVNHDLLREYMPASALGMRNSKGFRRFGHG